MQWTGQERTVRVPGLVTLEGDLTGSSSTCFARRSTKRRSTADVSGSEALLRLSLVT
jgi:hypothetical protein